MIFLRLHAKKTEYFLVTSHKLALNHCFLWRISQKLLIFIDFFRTLHYNISKEISGRG